MNNTLKNKSIADKLIDKANKLDSLLVLIIQSLKDGNVEIEEVEGCLSIAWDINYEVTCMAKKIFSAQ